MSSTSLLLALASLLLASLSPAVAQNPAFVPSITWTTAAPAIIPRRTYPSCTYNIHQPFSNPLMFMLGGETDTNNQILNNDVWYSTDGYYNDAHQITPQALLNQPGVNFTHRRAAAAAYLSNGNLLWFGGKSDSINANAAQLNSVYLSTDNGFSWSASTAQWSPRSDIAACVAPYTNTVMAIGGQIPTGTTLVNEVWISTDGAGATWTQQANVTLPQFHAGSCVFFYDASTANNSYTNVNPTLFLTVPTGSTYVTSTDLGNTWSAQQTGPWGAYNFLNVLTDTNNVIYVLGGQNSGNSLVWWSNNYGGQWYSLAATQSLNLVDAATYTSASTSCAALTFYRNLSYGIPYRAIAIYGGSVLLSDGAIDEAVHGVLSTPLTFPNAPGVKWTTAGIANVPRRTYPACTYNVHANPTLQPAMFILGGEVNYTNQVLANDIWYSTDGFFNDARQILPTSLLNQPGVNFTHRRAGSAAYLANGNLLWFGGKTDNATNSGGGQINSVYMSTDQGFTWSASTAQWSARSDMAACSPPGTSTVLMAGGAQYAPAGQTSPNVGEVWISTDGTGATWTMQSNVLPTFHAGECAFFYDVAMYNSSLTNTVSTLFVIINTGQFYTSTNLGVSFSAPTFGPWTVASQSRNFMNLLIDRQNNVYVFSGQNVYDNNIYYSTSMGRRWTVLPESNNLNLADGAYLSYATTSCAALTRFYDNTTGNFYRAISIYGGSVWLSDGNIVESIHAITTQALPIPAGVPQLSWSQASPNIMPRRTYQSCAVNIHAAPTQLPKIFMLGGEVNYTNQILTNDVWYSTDGFFSDSHQIQPTSLLNSPGTNFTHRRAGAAVYLANGNLLWFGGKTDDPSNASGGQIGSVYYSTDDGSTWSINMAQWSPRSDVAACVPPMTNTVYFAGGQQYSETTKITSATNEAWISTDGTGAQWTRNGMVPVAGFQSGACQFFWDSNNVNSSYTQSTATLMLLDNIGHIWFSTNLGQSYTGGSFGPWLVDAQARNYLNLVIDRDNLVYVLGGQNYYDSSVYFSSNKGMSWNVLPATNLLNQADGAQFYYATTSCAAMLNYQQNGRFYKSLTVYGGSIWLTDNRIFESIHALTTLPSSASVTSYSYSAYLPSRFGGQTGGAGSTNNDNGGGRSLSGGAIAGIVIGSVVGAILLCALILAVVLKGGRSDKRGSKQLEESRTGASHVHTNDVENSTMDQTEGGVELQEA